MGNIRPPRRVLLLLAAFGSDPQSLAWARDVAERAWGPIALSSPVFDFEETDYYQTAMGGGLKKTFLVFQRLIDPARLAEIKCRTNAWEDEYREMGRENGRSRQVERPLNLDPGYLTEAKLVLASTKDHAHRIYLSQGIYAEVTLRFRAGDWQPWEWTYPDYRRTDYQRFFTECRDYLREHVKSEA
ncbi:MAG: DUF4416 family protein [Pirellulales bacterium]